MLFADQSRSRSRDSSQRQRKAIEVVILCQAVSAPPRDTTADSSGGRREFYRPKVQKRGLYDALLYLTEWDSCVLFCLSLPEDRLTLSGSDPDARDEGSHVQSRHRLVSCRRVCTCHSSRP